MFPALASLTAAPNAPTALPATAPATVPATDTSSPAADPATTPTAAPTPMSESPEPPPPPPPPKRFCSARLAETLLSAPPPTRSCARRSSAAASSRERYALRAPWGDARAARSDQSLRDHELPPSENLAPDASRTARAVTRLTKSLDAPASFAAAAISPGVATMPLAAITRHAATLATADRAPGWSAACGGRASSTAPSEAAVEASPDGHASTAAAAADASPSYPPNASSGASPSREDASIAAATTSTLPDAATSTIQWSRAAPPPSLANTAATALVARAPATRSGAVRASPSSDASLSRTDASTYAANGADQSDGEPCAAESPREVGSGGSASYTAAASSAAALACASSELPSS